MKKQIQTNEFGVRWAEWGRRDQRVNKQKFFSTEESLNRFVAKLLEKESFISIEGWFKG